jgi:hypothetical protein
MSEPKRTYVAVQPVEVVNADSITLTIGNIGIKGSSDGGTTFQFAHTDTSGDFQIDVLSSALPSGAATLAEQQSQTAALGATTDAPLAYNGDDEGATARSHTSLLKRLANGIKAAAASLASIVTNTTNIPNVYNSGNTSWDTTETSPVALQRADLATYINAVTTTTSGMWVTFTSKSITTLYCLVSAWTSGTVTFAVYRNTSASDTGQILVHSEVLSAAGGKVITIDGDPGFIKVVVTISDTATATVGYMSKGL